MKQNLIKDVVQRMLPYLNNAQNEKLQEVLQYTFANYDVTENKQQEKKFGAELYRTVLISKENRGLFREIP